MCSARRSADICVRYAGDEFIVVLSGCGADEADSKRLELQRAIDEVYFEARPGKKLALGISVGSAVFPQDGESCETLLATADSRMYPGQDRTQAPRGGGADSPRRRHPAALRVPGADRDRTPARGRRRARGVPYSAQSRPATLKPGHDERDTVAPRTSARPSVTVSQP